MAVLHAAQALTPTGWRSDTRIVVDGGLISSIEVGVSRREGDETHAVLLPGMPNVHSHAFQRAMAGLTERRGADEDDFWSWRELMYKIALEISPVQLEAIAAQAYVEMLEAGYSRVGEFHYLHNDRDGSAYADPGEMASRIAAAAAETGIGLTLLPVFYAHATFAGAPPLPEQKRFVSDAASYQRLLDSCRTAVRPLANASVGVAPHSLRAVTPAELTAVTALAGAAPIHIHIAEQTKEVDACLAWSGRRPVAWLLDHVEVDARWCLVHATHMTEPEARELARTGASVGLCPITEANLGDGVFDARTFLAHAGRYGIGSDSNVEIGVADELRLLEYAQRLFRRARNVMAVRGLSTGRSLFESAASGGAAALGCAPAGLCAGAAADFFTLRRDHPAVVARDGDDILDTWIFTGGDSAVDCLWVAGRKLVSGGRHHRRTEVARRFESVLRELRGAL